MSLATLFRKKPIAEIERDAELGSAASTAASPPSRTCGGRWGDRPHRLRHRRHHRRRIFSAIGNACFHGGPAVSSSSSSPPSPAPSRRCATRVRLAGADSGSAYTYAYASFGELVAWIIGWDLLIEYAIGNIAVAISWSDYFTSLLGSIRIGSLQGLHLPAWMTMDYLSASRGYHAVTEAWRRRHAGAIAATRRVAPASLLGVDTAPHWAAARHRRPPGPRDRRLITVLVYIGIRESKRASNAMVVFKLAIIFVVIGVGAFYVDPANWHPFAPNGITGVLKGVSGGLLRLHRLRRHHHHGRGVQEPAARPAARDVYSLVICTVLYVLIALVLTGMAQLRHAQVGDPLAFVFGPTAPTSPGCAAWWRSRRWWR
jgi:hypothetical protein